MLAYKEKIHDWFEAHKQEMLLCLQELVRVPSVASDPEPNAPYGKEVARALDTALAMAERFGLEGATYWNLMRPFAQNWAMLSQYVRVRRGD